MNRLLEVLLAVSSSAAHLGMRVLSDSPPAPPQDASDPIAEAMAAFSWQSHGARSRSSTSHLPTTVWFWESKPSVAGRNDKSLSWTSRTCKRPSAAKHSFRRRSVSHPMDCAWRCLRPTIDVARPHQQASRLPRRPHHVWPRHQRFGFTADGKTLVGAAGTLIHE